MKPVLVTSLQTAGTTPPPPSRPTAMSKIIASFARHLRAGNLSENTIDSYLDAAYQLADFLHWNRLPLEPEKIKREHVEGFIRSIEQKHPGTATPAIRAGIMDTRSNAIP